MKLSKTHFYSRVHRIPELKFEDQRLTSYSGIVILQAFFKRINLKQGLKKCFTHLESKSIVGFHIITMILIINIMLGFRKLRDVERFSDDPMVLRTLQLRRIPNVSTNPRMILETRHDSAFFSDKIVKILDSEGAEFTISVPFERFAELKGIIESRKRWKKLNDKWSFFESDWSPKCWDKNFRFIFIRQKVKKQNKEPIQLHLFRPHEYGYDFKVIITNKKCSAKKVLQFHNGRGTQENIFSELKSQCQMDYIPVKKAHGKSIIHNVGSSFS